jgi:L-ascorbate metabolism protein UlaG (beta-lactamase superfamily)
VDDDQLVIPITSVEPRNRLSITYVGHATLLIEFQNVCILTDPNFDDKLGYFLPRVTPPGVKLAELPRIDAILLTHAHADHLSFRTLKTLPGEIPILAPPAVAKWLQRSGISSARAIRAGELIQIGRVTIVASRARHTGARYVIDRWRGETHMYLMDDGMSSVIFSGDTALTPAAEELTRRVAPRQLDVVLLPIGFAPWWKRYFFRRGHLTPADALATFTQVNARFFIPFHWGTFRHITSGPHDAINVLRALLPTYGRRSEVRILAPGETLRLIDFDQ